MSAPSSSPPRRSATTSSKFTSRSRKDTNTSLLSEDAIPEVDPNTTTGLLSHRVDAWRGVVSHLEDYMTAIEKVHRSLAKDYEHALKAMSLPLKHGDNFDQSTTGVAGFLENIRSNTDALITGNAETGKIIKGSVLPMLERLSKELKAKSKELSHDAEKNVKGVEKTRNATQKQIELLGQHSASFDSTGGQVSANDDPYVLYRGVWHRLHHQVLQENNHRNDLLAVQTTFASFESHVLGIIQRAMTAFTQAAAGQGETTRVLHNDMLASVQRIPLDFEWNGFVKRSGDRLMDPTEPPRNAEALSFANMNHVATKALIEGTLERKSRNKLSFGYHTAYYVVTPARYLHEFKDSDNVRTEPKPELSIYLPDAVIGAPFEDKFNIKGKDQSKSIGSKLTGAPELSFKAHTAADAQRWFDVIKGVCGATGPAEPEPETMPEAMTALASGSTDTPAVAPDYAPTHAPAHALAPAATVASLPAPALALTPDSAPANAQGVVSAQPLTAAPLTDPASGPGYLSISVPAPVVTGPTAAPGDALTMNVPSDVTMATVP